MGCPLGCERTDGIASDWTVPGMKRHVRAIHRPFLDHIVWPPLYKVGTSAAGDRLRAAKLHPPRPFEEMTVKELRAAAKRRGIPAFAKNKADFIGALMVRDAASCASVSSAGG